jgi:hypothetical protein
MIYGTAATPNKFIELLMEHSIGLKKLNGTKFSEHQKCPSCKIGKSQINDKPESIKLAEKPLAKVNFNLISSSCYLDSRIQILCCAH